MTTATVIWPTGPVSITWERTNDASLPVTAAHGFCFFGSKAVLCGIAGRGLSIPGGHLEHRETAEHCLRREAAEEASVELGSVIALGYLMADHSVNSAYCGPYPTKAAQLIFLADVIAMHEFVPKFESAERVLVPIVELPSYHQGWNPVLQAAYEDALLSAKSRGVAPARTV